MKERKQINVEVGENVRSVREEAHMTQEQFAELIEVSPQFLSDLERGLTGISIATLKRICERLSIPSDRILFGKSSTNDTSAIMEKCSLLPKDKFDLLVEIILKYIQAVNL